MVGCEGGARVLEGDAQAALGHCAPGLARLTRRIDAREQPRADEEILLPSSVPEAIQPVLDAGRRRADSRADAPRQRIAIERRGVESRVDDAVEHMGMHRGDAGKTRGAAENLGKQRQQG